MTLVGPHVVVLVYYQIGMVFHPWSLRLCIVLCFFGVACVWCLCSWVLMVGWFAIVVAPSATIVLARQGPCWHTSPSPIVGLGPRSQRLFSSRVIALRRHCGWRDLGCLVLVVWMVSVTALFCGPLWAMWVVSVVPPVVVVARALAPTLCFLVSGVVVVVLRVLSVFGRLGCPLVVWYVVRGHRAVARVLVFSSCQWCIGNLLVVSWLVVVVSCYVVGLGGSSWCVLWARRPPVKPRCADVASEYHVAGLTSDDGYTLWAG